MVKIPFLVRFDRNFDTLWTREYGDTAFQSGWACKQTKDGGFIIAGVTTTYDYPTGDFLLIKTDSLGNMQWQNHYGRQGYRDMCVTMALTNDGGYLMAGQTWQYIDGTWPDFYFVKTDSLGNLKWTKQFGGPYDDAIWSIIKTKDGSYVGVGYKTLSIKNLILNVVLIFPGRMQLNWIQREIFMGEKPLAHRMIVKPSIPLRN